MFHYKKERRVKRFFRIFRVGIFTMSPTAVSEIFNSCVCEPNFAAVFTHNGKHLQGMTGRKSVTTNCKHWNAIRIRASPWRSLTAPIIPSTKGHPCDSVSPAPFSTCKTHSNWRCRTSPCGTDDSSARGFNRRVCRVWKMILESIHWALVVENRDWLARTHHIVLKWSFVFELKCRFHQIGDRLNAPFPHPNVWMLANFQQMIGQWPPQHFDARQVHQSCFQ